MSTVLAYSGGIDSTVLLYHLQAGGEEVACLGVNYGQRHRRELEYAEQLCFDLDVNFTLAGVDGPFGGSELTDGRGGPVVPNRNMMLLALAGARAVTIDADYVAIACHKGDALLFPDCRGPFLDSASACLMAATERRIRLLRPFVGWTKIDIVKRGLDLAVPFDLTWSCYREGPEPCGECLACRERREALLLAGAPA